MAFRTSPCLSQQKEKSVDETQIIASDEQDTATRDPEPKPGDTTSVKGRLDQQRQRLLAELPGQPKAIWIEVDGEKRLGFWHPDQSGKPVGAVLLLPAREQSSRWSQTLAQLHHHLPKHGWATLSLELPDWPDSSAPIRSSVGTIPAAPLSQLENTAPVDETLVVHQEVAPPVSPAQLPVQTTTVEIRSAIQRTITAATQYLHQQGQYNLVILGEGESGLWALEHLDHAVKPPAPSGSDETRKAVVERAVRALILLNARVPETLDGSELIQHLRHPDVPTLDVYTDPTLVARSHAATRKQASIKAGYGDFVQRHLPPPTGANEQNQITETHLTKTLRGFLHKHARGVELD